MSNTLQGLKKEYANSEQGTTAQKHNNAYAKNDCMRCFLGT